MGGLGIIKKRIDYPLAVIPKSGNLASKILMCSFNLDNNNHKLSVEKVSEYVGEYYLRLTLPNLLMESISEYVKKPVESLEFADMLLMCNSVSNSSTSNIFHDEVYSFSRNNDLSFFRLEQYRLMNRYVNSVLD